MERVTICGECKFALGVGDPDGVILPGHCLSTDAPISDYVNGFKYCKDINKKGDCEFFKGYTGKS